MTDPVQPVNRTEKPQSWLAGRANRREYWISVGVLLAVVVAAGMLGLEYGGGIIAGLLMVFWIRRFHDLGRTGWWAPAILFWQAVASALAFGLGGATALAVVSLAVILVPLVWIGALPGQPFENRFGPPPGRADVAQTFS
ncbi:DUF805 domain-containing protein [Phenylobacterium sp.]|uniref:DUF805 domain-containing protein n=1 Tax=Phenylobacterium sp. TaxID=1871053 RepID=UPI002FE15940